MRELTLTQDEFAEFSVPHALCLAGEYQYALGLGSVVVASGPRLQAHVQETAEEFEICAAPPEAPPHDAPEMAARWRPALEKLAVTDPQELDGLRITLAPDETEGCLLPGLAASDPTVAVALACAVKAHRGDIRSMPTGEMAELAATLLLELPDACRSYPDRFYSECLGCVGGGACYASPSAGALNVQLMIPPESLILAASRRVEASPAPGSWERVLLGALNKLGRTGAELLAATERDVSPLFELPAGMLDERETTVLYGLLRVREMIAEHLERLGEPLLDNDLLAELCDEESFIMEDYFEFPAAPYREVRNRAIEIGALGTKLTHAFGTRPAMIILAPGCRAEVSGELGEEFGDCRFLPVDVEPLGAAGTDVPRADDAAEPE